MTLPQWLIQLGSVGGLLSFSVTVWDRLITGRPLVWISPSEHRGRDLHFKNVYSSDILIRRIRCFPSNVGVSLDHSVRSIARVVTGDSFVAVLRSEAEADFPIIFRRGELFDEDNNEWAPFCVVVSWRKSHSHWFPQIPKVILSSARTVRILQEASVKESED
jgi:hypothetical protein